jgi:uncharacterized MnhB-related membrane protein
MKLLKNITTVLFLIFVAYVIFTGWSVRQVIALAVFGFAIDMFFNMFMSRTDENRD